ncbi:hypothetical protein TNCV_3386061 [Trichonephila clavipes]|nr:hypothetical protein TNCV_3386061 [Trichonephila clavipes]
MWFPYSRHGQRVMNMDRYTNAELADIHFNYEPANRNGRVAICLHWERFPTRWQSNAQTFAWVHQNLEEHRSFRALFDDILVRYEMDLVA